MNDVLMLICLGLALPVAVCLIFAAGMLFIAYAFWVITMFGTLMEWLIPALKNDQ